MKFLNHLQLPGKLTAFVDLNNVLKAGLRARMASLSNMSGYPVGNHAVGRLVYTYLQNGTYNEMVRSVKRLRDLARYTSDMINTAPMFRVEKSALNRTELIAYIDLNSTAAGLTLTAEEKDFVAYITISAESSDIGWTLSFSTDPKENRFLQFHDIYASMVNQVTPTYDSSGTLTAVKTSFDLNYNLATDDLETFIMSDKVRSISADLKQQIKALGKVPPSVELLSKYNLLISNAFVVHTLACMRVVDHLFALVNDTSIWTSFIPPRTKPDSSQNYERAKGLKAFSCYTHSLLMYPHFLSLELFLLTFEKLNSWITIYAPLKSSVVALYDHTVKKFDVLSAGTDARLIMDQLDQDSNNPSGSAILGIPSQFATIFGIDEMYEQSINASNLVATKVTIVDLTDLKAPAYRNYMLAAPIASYNVAGDMTKVLNFGDMVSDVIKRGSSAIQNGLTRFYQDEPVSRLFRMSIKIPYAFSHQILSVDNVTDTTECTLEGGSFNYAPLTPMSSYEYQLHVRDSLTMSIFTSNSLVHNKVNDFSPKVLLNKSKAKDLRDMLMNDFTSLIPSDFTFGDVVYTPSQFATGNAFSDLEAIKRLLSAMTGLNFEVIKRQIGTEFLKETWATYLSSFALLYVSPLDLHTGVASNNKQQANFVTMLTPTLVVGHGAPYGTTYSGLEGMQPVGLNDDYIFITEGIYIRFLVNIPLPSDGLKASDNFHLHHPYYYYGASSGLMKVSRWVMSEGLLHMALSKPFALYPAPPMLLGLNYGYLNDRLVHQLDPIYSITNKAAVFTKFAMPISINAWTQDRYIFNIHYKNYGAYSTSALTATEVTITPLTEIIDQMDRDMLAAEKDSKMVDNASSGSPIDSFDIESNKGKKKKFNPEGDSEVE